MKRILNIGLSLLLFITIGLATASLTIFNKSYVKLSATIHNYYQTIIDNINKELEIEHTIDKNNVRSDVNNFIDSYYEDRVYSHKIETSSDIDESYLTDLYNKNIKEIKPSFDMRLFHDIFDVLTIVFIIITGAIFVKTKKKHDIKTILITSSILGIILSGIIYIFNNFNGLTYLLINDMYYIYLGINIILILYLLFIYINNKYHLFKKVVNNKR